MVYCGEYRWANRKDQKNAMQVRCGQKPDTKPIGIGGMHHMSTMTNFKVWCQPTTLSLPACTRTTISSNMQAPSSTIPTHPGHHPPWGTFFCFSTI